MSHIGHVDGKADVAADTVSQRSVSPATPAIHRMLKRLGQQRPQAGTRHPILRPLPPLGDVLLNRS
jgi:hypothetical protein